MARVLSKPFRLRITRTIHQAAVAGVPLTAGNVPADAATDARGGADQVFGCHRLAREFAGNADELTEPVCPEARAAVIEITGKSSLSAVVR